MQRKRGRQRKKKHENRFVSFLLIKILLRLCCYQQHFLLTELTVLGEYYQIRLVIMHVFYSIWC